MSEEKPEHCGKELNFQDLLGIETWNITIINVLTINLMESQPEYNVQQRYWERCKEREKHFVLSLSYGTLMWDFVRPLWLDSMALYMAVHNISLRCWYLWHIYSMHICSQWMIGTVSEILLRKLVLVGYMISIYVEGGNFALTLEMPSSLSNSTMISWGRRARWFWS